MADEKFKTFKKRYQEGKITTTQMPPLPAGPAGLGRQIAGAAAGTGLRALRDAFTKQQKNAARNAKRREAAAEKKAARAKEKFGPLAKREENLPATQGSRAVVKRKDNLPATQGSRSLTVAREGKGDLVRTGGGRSLATTGGRTFGDKGQGGRIVGLSNKGKLAAGAIGAGGAAAAYAGYKKAGGADAGTKPASGPRDDRASSLSTAPKTDREKSASDFKSKMQGRKVPGSPTSTERKPVKAASDKSNYKPKAAKAEKPLSNFERMKARGYEKEGYGGRSMTSKGAESRVKKERGFKFKDLFKK